MANLLMSVPRNKRHIDFRRLTGSQRTPRDWGVTLSIHIFFIFKSRSSIKTLEFHNGGMNSNYFQSITII